MYPWPPPPGWSERSDGRYWPADHDIPAPAGSFAPRHGPAKAPPAPETLPPPRPADRHGPPPLRFRSILALALGAVGLLVASATVRLDVLGFTLEPARLGAGEDAGPPARVVVPLGEEQRLTEATIADLLELHECTNLGGAAAVGEVTNPLNGERAYLITVHFDVDGERQLDGFSEVVVPPGVTSSFSAFSASPPVDGSVTCRLGDVFRFIPD